MSANVNNKIRMDYLKMKNNKRFFLFIVQIIIFNCFIINNAFAYFDHGTGSLLIQSTIAFFGMMVFYIRRIKDSVIFFFKRLLGIKKKKHESAEPLEK